MKMKMIKEPVFESYCRVIWDCTQEELKDYLIKEFNYETSIKNGTQAKFIEIDNGPESWLEWIIWTKDFDIMEFLHEITHLIFNIMRFKGIPICQETEEVFIHLQIYYVRQIKGLMRRIK